jgi:hypothetical protein
MQEAEHLEKLHRILRGVARHSFDRPKRYLPGGIYRISIILHTPNDILTKKFFSTLRVKFAVLIHATHALSDHGARLGYGQG